jgi:acetyl-CoA carboxylase biotin carboxyl carrier protein
MKLDKIRELLDIMDANNLAEIEIEEDGVKIRLRKGELPSEALVTTVPAGEKTVTVPLTETPSADTVNAPMVGTFYRAPSPDAPPYVDIGDSVTADTVVCIVEAMKVMNEIKSGLDGVVTEILAETGSAVEYGHPLFRIEPV